MDNKPTVNVIDADFIPFYVCYNKKGDEPKTLQACLDICDDFINNINKYTGAVHYIGYLTVGKCFRYTINTEYKANRKYTNVPDYTLDVRKHMIEKHGFKGQDGYEADDLVISFKDQHPEYNCIIVSPDKDILNLEGRHFNPREMKYIRTTAETAEEFFWKSMIKGDSTDGIKGIPGKGPSAAESMSIEVRINGNNYYEEVLKMYINHFGEYEGIKEFTKNYLSLKLVNNVQLEDIKLNNVNIEISE